MIQGLGDGFTGQLAAAEHLLAMPLDRFDKGPQFVIRWADQFAFCKG